MDNLYLMIRLIEELAKLNVPIVFKGAMVLKTALQDLGLNTSRETRDIDGDWVGKPPTMQQLKSLVDTALLRVDPNLKSTIIREYSTGKAAGFGIMFNGNKLFSIDISIKQNPYNCIYKTMINGINFYGATTDKMFADKLHGVSNKTVFRRIKDVYDIYLLSALSGYNILHIHDILSNLGRTLGDFDGFTNQLDDLKHAYEKLRGVENKPPFSAVYFRVYTFIEPFIIGIERDLVWDGTQWIPANS